MINNNVRTICAGLILLLCVSMTISTMAMSPDLAGYWNFNNTTCDSSGNDNNGVVSGTTTWDNGKVGKAFDFNESTSIDCGWGSSMSIADNISIELWFCPKQEINGYAAYPISKWTSTSDANYVMYYFGKGSGLSRYICFYANAGGVWQQVSPSCQLTTNQWYHIVWTYNSVSGGNLYVNGSTQGSPTGSGALATNNASVLVGQCINGLIDEVKVYNRILTSTDIQTKIQEASLRGVWNLNGSAIDQSGNDNNGTVEGTANWAMGLIDKDMFFNGNTAINFGSDSSLSIADDISIEFWWYPEQWASGYAEFPICKWTSINDANYVMYFFGPDAGANNQKIGFLAKAGGTWQQVSPLYLLPYINTWYHIVWTYNSVSGGNLYINGTLQGSPTGSGTLATNNASVYLGKLPGTEGISGLIDEVKLYSRVLNPQEVAAKHLDVGTSVTTLENSTLRLTINGSGKITELTGKPAGSNYSGGTVDFAKVNKNGTWYSSSSCLNKDNRLIVDFGDANITMEITTKIKDSYIVFQVYSVYGDTNGLQELQLLNINPPLGIKEYISGRVGDANFTLALRAMNGRSDVTISSVFPGIWHPENGLALAKFALLGSPTGSLVSALQTMITNEQLPTSSQGGPWASNVNSNRDSYIFVYDITPTNVSSYITSANSAGCKFINFYSWWNTLGHYGVNSTYGSLANMKSCVDAIHAAYPPLKASIHCLSGYIDPTDSYVSPVPDSRLQKDAEFTHNSIIGSSDTTIYVNEQPSASLSDTGNILQIGNELIKYSKYNNTPPYSFTGCTRGFYGTAVQSHSAADKVRHLRTCLNYYFFQDPDSTLVREMADRIAYVTNYCGFDMIYLDGAEGIGSNCASYRMGTAIFNRIGRPIRVETSLWDHKYWTFYSNIGAMDFPLYGTKKFVDIHAHNMACYDSVSLLPVGLGWWSFWGPSDYNYTQFPDEVEFLCTRALGCNAALSYADFSLSPVNQRQSEYCAMIKAYEDLRASGNVSDSVKSQLLVWGNEFHLTTSPTTIKRRDNLAHKVTSLTDGSQNWTVNNQFSAQPVKLRIQALHSAGNYDQTGIALTSFTQAGELALSAAPNITCSATYNQGICTYNATNNSNSSTKAWAKATKTFSPALNIGSNDTLGVWVYGDGKGEILNFQLYSNSVVYYDERYVVVNFSGWKYFELFIRERDAEKCDSLSWTYSGDLSGIHRVKTTPSCVNGINIYYNNLPVGQQASCQIKVIKALPTTSININSPSITVNNNTITFPVTLSSGQYIEFYGSGTARLYNTDGTYTSFTPQGNVPTLNSGNNNNISFTGTTPPPGFNTRANVTFFVDGGQIYP